MSWTKDTKSGSWTIEFEVDKCGDGEGGASVTLLRNVTYEEMKSVMRVLMQFPEREF